MKGWGTARVDWREPPAMWIGLGWLAATLWPPLPLTWLLWPASQSSLAQLLDWRVLATVMGGLDTTVTFRLIERERRREGQPRTRYNDTDQNETNSNLFSVLCALILAVLG